MQYTAVYPSPVGRLTLSSDGAALTGLWLEGQKYFAATLPAGAAPEEDLPAFAAARQWLDSYFAGERPDIEVLSLAPRGSEFQRMIWKLLREIPYGELTTYRELAAEAARRIGRGSMSAQAVGGAVAHNPISIIIPCHRVVGSGGSLTGYAGGVERKLWLFRHEGVDTERLTVPKRGTAL